jgi:hypothetical protein
MLEIQMNIEKEKDTQASLKRSLRQQVLQRFYAHEDVDTDRQSTSLKRCSSSETLNGPGSSFTLTQELSVDSNRAVITQALTATAKAHKELALRALSKHSGQQFRIVLKEMKFEGLYVEERKGIFKRIWGLKASPESFTMKQVSGAFRFSSNRFVSTDKRAQVDAVTL